MGAGCGAIFLPEMRRGTATPAMDGAFRAAFS